MSKAEQLARILNGEAQEIEAVRKLAGPAWGSGLLASKETRTPRNSNERLKQVRADVKAK